MKLPDALLFASDAEVALIVGAAFLVVAALMSAAERRRVRRARIDRWLEKRAVATASGFVTVSPPLAEILERKFSRPTRVRRGRSPAMARRSPPAIIP